MYSYFTLCILYLHDILIDILTFVRLTGALFTLIITYKMKQRLIAAATSVGSKVFYSYNLGSVVLWRVPSEVLGAWIVVFSF